MATDKDIKDTNLTEDQTGALDRIEDVTIENDAVLPCDDPGYSYYLRKLRLL